MSDTSSSGTERCLVQVESETHRGEWLRMVACPIPHCDAVWGEDYERFAPHLAAEHGPEDVGLSSKGRRVATDGGTKHVPVEKLTKDELYEEIVEIAGLPEKETTGSYTFRREHLVQLVRYLRTESDR